MFGTIRNVNAETLRHKDLKYPTHDLCLAKISHSSLVQKIHALVALPLDAGILCTSDLCEIQNTLLIIRDSLRSSSHDIVGYFLPATRHQWGILRPYTAKSQYRSIPYGICNIEIHSDITQFSVTRFGFFNSESGQKNNLKTTKFQML